MAKKKSSVGMMMSCCTSSWGMIHLAGGVGLGFLLASYFAIPGMMLWGWILIAVALVGHLTGKSMCR